MHEEDQDSSSRNPPSVGNPSPCQLSPHLPPPTAVYHPPPPGAPMYPHPGHLPPQLPPPTTVLIPPAQSTNYNTDRITDQHNYNYYGPVHNSGQAQDVPQNRGMAQEDPGSADTINSDVETKLRENFSKVKVNRDELDKAMEVMNGLKMVSCKEAMIRQIHRGVKLTDLKKYIDLMCESLNLPKEHEKQLRAKLEIIELADDTCDAPLTVDYEYSNFKSVYGFLCAIKTAVQRITREAGNFLQGHGLLRENFTSGDLTINFSTACFVTLVYHMRDCMKENKTIQTNIKSIFDDKKKAEQILKIPKAAMQSMKDFDKYITDTKVGGIVEEKQVKVHFVGNTRSGKTSIIRTVKAGESSMTGNNPELLGTKVMETHRNLSLDAETTYVAGKPGKRWAKLTPKTSTEDDEKKPSLTFFDSGGHQQYSLFNEAVITDGSVIAVCIDATKFNYSTCVSPYLDLIFSTKKSLAILLLATHCYEDVNIDVDEGKLIHMVKEHCKGRYKSMGKKGSFQGPVFIPMLFKLSNKIYRGIDEFKGGLLAVCNSDEILPMPSKYPTIWKEFQNKMKENMVDGAVSMQEADQMYRALQETAGNTTSTYLTSKELDQINEIQRIAQGIQDGSLKLERKEDDVDSEDSDSDSDTVDLAKGLSKPAANTVSDQIDINNLADGSNATALQYLRDTGTILTFNNKIYPDVDLVFDSLKFVIRHDLNDQLKRRNIEGLMIDMPLSFSLERELNNVYQMGRVSYNILRLLYYVHQKKEKHILKMDHIVSILQQMGIVYKTLEGDEKYWLFIPSLIQESIQELKCKNFDFCQILAEEHKKLVEVQYHFDMGFGSMNIVNQFLVKFCESEKSATIQKTFCEQVENRKPGIVSFSFFTIGSQDIFLKEEEVLEEDEGFYRSRCITIAYKAQDVLTDTEEAISSVDEVLQSVIDKTGHRRCVKRVTCSSCRTEQGFNPKYLMLPTKSSLGYFIDFEPSITRWENYMRCSNPEKRHKKHSPLVVNISQNESKLDDDCNQWPTPEKSPAKQCTVKRRRSTTARNTKKRKTNHQHQCGDTNINNMVVKNTIIINHFGETNDEEESYKRLLGLVNEPKEKVEEAYKALQSLTRLQPHEKLHLPAVSLLTQSNCLIRHNAPNQDPTIGTGFWVSSPKGTGAILFSAGHNFVDKVRKVPVQKFDNFELFFNNLPGCIDKKQFVLVDKLTAVPPIYRKFTDFTSKFNYTIVVTFNGWQFIEESKNGQKAQKPLQQLAGDEALFDYFALVLHDQDAPDKLRKDHLELLECAKPPHLAPTVPACPAPTIPTNPASTVPACPAPTVTTNPAPTVPTNPAPTVPTNPAPTVPTNPASTVPAASGTPAQIQCSNCPNAKGDPVFIIGHPGVEKYVQSPGFSWKNFFGSAISDLRHFPLRLSYGNETGSIKQRVVYDMDTVGGNSGSPILGKKYTVKAIHVQGAPKQASTQGPPTATHAYDSHNRGQILDPVIKDLEKNGII